MSYERLSKNFFCGLGFCLRGISLKAIALYRTIISPWLGCHCRFEPTCSKYAEDAIVEYGFLRGVFKAGARVLKCHPFHSGGFDPVQKPANGMWLQKEQKQNGF